jgi:hypothetical protein
MPREISFVECFELAVHTGKNREVLDLSVEVAEHVYMVYLQERSCLASWICIGARSHWIVRSS